MKSLIIVVLLIAVGLLAVQNALQRNDLAHLQSELADQQDHAKPEKGRIDLPTAQSGQLPPHLTGSQGLQPAGHGPQPAAQPTATPAALADAYTGALVIVEGKNAVGSGFLCNMAGRTYVITNAHVLCNNPGLKVTNVKGVAFNIGSGAIAVDHDIVRLEVTGAEQVFDLMPDINSAKINDTVTVLGNSGGAGVVTSVNGSIVGFGPNLVEVDAAFIPGNSGSPIVHDTTRQVIGVATYTLKRTAQDGSVQSEVRRFGYRLDDIKQWETLNWQSFYAQSAQLDAIETLSEDFVKLIGQNGNVLTIDPAGYASPALQRAIRLFQQTVRDRGRIISVEDKKHLLEGFIADLRSVSHADIVAFNSNVAAYDYFRREVADQARFRDEIYQGLTRALQNFQ